MRLGEDIQRSMRAAVCPLLVALQPGVKRMCVKGIGSIYSMISLQAALQICFCVPLRSVEFAMNMRYMG